MDDFLHAVIERRNREQLAAGDATCANCGAVLNDNNRTGFCSKRPPCEKARRRAARKASPAANQLVDVDPRRLAIQHLARARDRLLSAVAALQAAQRDEQAATEEERAAAELLGDAAA